MILIKQFLKHIAGTLAPITMWLMIIVPLSLFVFPRDGRLKDGMIEIVPVQTGNEFPDAAEPGALNFACSATRDGLRSFFEAEGLVFDQGLLREMDGAECHIYYRPSAPGFRADPDDLPVDGLVMNVNMLHFLSHREKVLGDTLDITRVLSREIDRPITFYLSLGKGHDQQLYEQALQFHYPDSIHDFQILPVEFEGSNPWVQDYLKVGHREGQRMALIPRHLFEGVSDNGERFGPALAALMRDTVVRSRLSWEGGDFQFVRLPGEPDKVAMLYGSSAKPYWGSELTREEYAYVLRREFGADVAIDVSGVEGHVDYFFAFIPRSRVVLVSHPETGNEAVIQDAVRNLLEGFPLLANSASGEKLEKILTQGVKGNVKAAQEAIDEFREQAEALAQRTDPDLEARMVEYVQRKCPEAPSECFSFEGQAKLLEEDRSLLRDWTTAALEERSRKQLLLAYLAIMESQLYEIPAGILEYREEKKEILRELEFEVIEVPRFGLRPERELVWPGISYVNGLLIDDKYFAPVFGLGESEDRLLEEVRERLPDSIQMVLVPAQHMLLNSGGIHCTTGIVRQLAEPY